MIRPQSRRAGALMLEALVMLTALGAGMAVGGMALIVTLRTQRVADLVHQQLIQRRDLAEQFRADVNRATATLDLASLGDGKVLASPTCLILQGPAKQLVIYRWESQQLDRIEIKGSETIRRPLPVGPKTGAVEMERGTGKNPLITLKLRDEAPKGQPETSFELQAALGGDWR
jgi:hypothetical protein